jgi:aerobic-type carbon monoxide dehydrogenase small subunit (CoxS/CutS family)
MAATAAAIGQVRAKPAEAVQPSQGPEDMLAEGAPVAIKLSVNGKDYYATVEPRDMLVNVIREQLGLTGTKRPCNRMECGGCTVLIDDKPYYSCTYLAIRAQGKKILTVEGSGVEPVLSALQNAWHEMDASQCGYCQEGQLMSATALLKSNPNPTVDEIKAGMSGNLCRCGTYMNIIEAIQLASKSLRGAQ